MPPSNSKGSMATADVFLDYKWSGDEAYLSIRAKGLQRSPADPDSRLVRVPKDHLLRDFDLMLQIAAGVFGVSEWQQCALEVRHTQTSAQQQGAPTHKRVITSRREWLDFHAYQAILRGEKPQTQHHPNSHYSGAGLYHLHPHSNEPKKVLCQEVVLIRKPRDLPLNELCESDGTRRDASQALQDARTSSVKPTATATAAPPQVQASAPPQVQASRPPPVQASTTNVPTSAPPAARPGTAGDRTSQAAASRVARTTSSEASPVADSIQELIRASSKLYTDALGGWTPSIRHGDLGSTVQHSVANIPSLLDDLRRNVISVAVAATDVMNAAQPYHPPWEVDSRPGAPSGPVRDQATAAASSSPAAVPEQVRDLPTTVEALRPDTKAANQKESSQTNRATSAPHKQDSSATASGPTYDELMAMCRAQGEAQGRAFGEVSARRAAKLSRPKNDLEKSSSPSNVSDDGFSLVEHESGGAEAQAQRQHDATTVALGSATPSVPSDQQPGAVNTKSSQSDESTPYVITDEVAAHNTYMLDAWQKRLSEMGHDGHSRAERDAAMRGATDSSSVKDGQTKTDKGKQRAVSPSPAQNKASPEPSPIAVPVNAAQAQPAVAQADIESTNASLASGFEKLLQDMRQARNETPYAVRQTKASQIQASGDVRDPSLAQQQQQQQQPALGDQLKEDSSRPADQAQVNASPVAPGKEASTAPSEMNKQLENAFEAMLQKAQSTKAPK